MNSQSVVVSIQHAYLQHQQRQYGLELCKKLINLALEIQKHRGCTLAILSGDRFFETQLVGIQRDITESFQDFESYRREFLSLAESEPIMREWVCIRRLWRKDSIEENFLLHSNLIQELHKLIWLVVQRSNQLGIDDKQDELLRFCLIDWLNMIETSAQLRGLSTHLAVMREDDPALRSRLLFLDQEMSKLDNQIKQSIQQLDEHARNRIQLTKEKVNYEDYLNAFHSELEKEFLHKPTPDTDADKIYTQGSHVVSACHRVLLSGMQCLEKALSPELEAWVTGAN